MPFLTSRHRRGVAGALAVALAAYWAAGAAAEDGQKRERIILPEGVMSTTVHHGGQAHRIAYLPVPIAKATQTIVYIHGDYPGGSEPEEGRQREIVFAMGRRSERFGLANGVNMILLFRPGHFFSDGNHMHRRFRAPLEISAEALKQITARIDPENLAIAGHSGGASAALAALTLRGLNAKCIVGAAGSYHTAMALKHRGIDLKKFEALMAKLYEVSSDLASIPDNPMRIIVLLADRKDTKVPFESSVELFRQLTDLNHRAVLLEASASDPDHHNLTLQGFNAAVRCLRGANEAEISAKPPRHRDPFLLR